MGRVLLLRLNSIHEVLISILSTLKPSRRERQKENICNLGTSPSPTPTPPKLPSARRNPPICSGYLSFW
ncbi:hypothetical protein RchiOBHm_Chr7g0223671 [Rosa chinensis]|uniref:Uncharacterized protein n=1 Tax=Rosa chinensis TaxID=74649 RepID=A0A2P6PDM4_ROSCH|nr:hypothetical protein RchiOBHm_Chr7g0223671 [Rosa chinensis]